MLLVVSYFVFVVKEDCRLRCDDLRLIKCESDEDCKYFRMESYCKPSVPNLGYGGLSGFCDEGYCRSYGCGGVSSIK